MKLLIDANLSAVVVDGLVKSGFEAVHVGDVGLLAAADAEIFDFAAEHDLVVVTADSDFAMLLALESLKSVGCAATGRGRPAEHYSLAASARSTACPN